MGLTWDIVEDEPDPETDQLLDIMAYYSQVADTFAIYMSTQGGKDGEVRHPTEGEQQSSSQQEDR